MMVADITGPQTFSETVSVDSEDRRQVGIELLKLKTSAMDVQRQALPRGLKLEAEVFAKSETTKLYVARTKCIEASVETPSEQLDEGSAPVFVVQLQSLQTMDGGRARLVCRVRGRPMPVTTEWSHNGKIIAADSAEFVATYDKASGDASLTIAEVFPEDAGVYECFAENEFGQARTKAELTVEAYEYVADTEECYSESTVSVSSTHEATQQTLLEPVVEEVRAIDSSYEEDVVLMADVQWCLRNLVETQKSEVVSQFTVDATDGQKLIEHEYTVQQLVKPNISGRAHTLVQQQTQRTVEEQMVDELESISVEGHVSENVPDNLENPPTKHFPASWTFMQMSTLDEETLGEVVSERVSSPQNTSEQEVAYELVQSSVHVQPCHSGVTMECQSEGEEEDLFLDVPEPSVLPKPSDAYELNQVRVNDRQWMLTLLQRVFSESEITQPHQVHYTVESSTLEEVPRLFGLAAKALPTPTRAILQDVLQAFEEVSEKRPTLEVSELSSTVAAVLEQAARVEEARLSLVKPLLETNKICATKDLCDDELDDLLERSKSVLVRTEYLEPFREQLPLSHSLMSEVRVSPSRSVESVSPTDDLSMIPSEVEPTLEQAAWVEAARLSLVKPLLETNKVCATKDLYDNELDDLLERSRSVLVRTAYLEPFREQLPLSHTLMSEVRVSPSRSVGNVSPTNDLSVIPSVVETPLDEVDLNTCDVLFEEEIIPDQPAEVTRAPVPTFDSTDLLIVEDNLPEAASAIEDIQMVLCTPSMVQVDLDKADINVCNVLFEEEIIPEQPTEVTRAPVPSFDSTDLLILEDNLPEAVSAMEDVEVLSIGLSDIMVEVCKAIESEVDWRQCEEEMIVVEQTSVLERVPINWPDERSASPFSFDECLMEPVAVETATLTLSDAESVVLEKANVVKDDIYFVEEEHFILEATVDLQQLMKMTEQAMMHSDERCVSPFVDENVVLKPIPSQADYLSIAPQDHVTEPLACAQIHEADVYYYEEESTYVDIVCDLTQITQVTQRELIISEERAISPVQDETFCVQPLSTDIELISIDAVDHVTEPLACAQIHEADVYYYEEESTYVDIVCDLTQITQVTQRELIISEERAISPVQDETCYVQPLSTDIEVISIDAVDHVIEPLNHAKIDECDFYYYEEESFSVDVVCEVSQLLQRTTSDFSVEEHVAPETVQLESSVTETSAESSEIKPTDVDIAAKNRSSETFVLPQVIVHHVEATSRLSPISVGITAISSADSVALSTASIDECTICSQDQETFSESTLEQTTSFEKRLEIFKEEEGASDQGLEAQEEEIFSEVSVEQKSMLESEAHQRLEVPEDDVEMYSSGEETYDRWTVETYRVYVETRKVEADLMFRRNQLLAAAALDSSYVVKSSPDETQQREDMYEETRMVEADMTFSKQLEAFTTADTSQVVESAPVFTRPLFNRRVNEGQQVKLECHVIGSPCPQVKWFLDGVELSSSVEFAITRLGSACCLVINEVLSEDEGEYTVTASNEHGTVSTAAYLTVIKQDEGNDERESSGEEMYSSREETSRSWSVMEQRKKMMEQRKKVNVLEEFNKLEIDVSLQRKEPTSDTQYGEVTRQTEAPSFTKKLESADVFEGTPVRLECDVTGFPQPHITWYQNGKELDSCEHIQLDYTDGHCTLSIDRVSIEDEAEYVCTASNDGGSVSSWAELLVEKLIEGLEQLVMEEHYELEIEMNFKWQTKAQRLAEQKTTLKQAATII